MKFNLGIDVLRNVGSEYLIRNLLEEEEKVYIEKYDPKRIPIGRTIDKKILFLRFDDATVVTIFGARGVGKTFFLRNLMDRLYKADYDIAILTDIKNEFFTSAIKPVQEKFRKTLINGEKVGTTPVATIKPYFFTTVSGEGQLPQFNLWGSCDMRDVIKADFFEFMNYGSLTMIQQIELEKLYDQIEEMGGLKKIEDVDMLIESREDLDTTTKYSLLRRVYRLKKSKFFDVEHVVNPVELMTSPERYVPCLNLEGYQSFGSTTNESNVGNYPRAMVGMWLNMIRRARVKGMIKPLWFFIDEASRFCNSKTFSNVRAHVEENVDVDRRYNISLIGAWQSYYDVPEKILRQAKYMLFPNNIATEILQEGLKDAGLLDVSSQQKTIVNRIKREMLRFSKHSWLLIDRNRQEYIIFEPLCPLSWHSETTN